MHTLNNKCTPSLPRSDGAGLLLHMQAGRTHQRGKSAAYCLDGVIGLAVRSSLLYCFKEKRRQEVGDLKEVFPIGSNVCSDCSNIVEEYPKLRERWVRSAFLASQRPLQARLRDLLREQGPHFPWQCLAAIRAARGLTTTTMLVVSRRMVINNDGGTAKISVFPNPVGRDTQTSLPSQNAKIASSC